MKFSFNLVPFSLNTAPAVNLSGEVERQNSQLKIEYQLRGNLSQLIIFKPTNCPNRQYNLWEHTCFELFLGIKDSTKYWEFNLSPTGHWNIFHFANYRQNIAEEIAFNSLPFQIRQQSNLLQLNLIFNLDRIICPKQNIELGITTVVEDHQQTLSYWALSHPAQEADFHERASFLINF